MTKGAFRQRAGAFFNLREGRASHDTIRQRIVKENRLDGIHLATLMVAMTIASVGLNADSTGAVIGAMLICPLMGSVVASAYAIAAADRKLLRQAVMALLVQMTLCLITSTIYFLVSPVSFRTAALLDNSVTTPWDIIIAFAGGFAGAIGYSRKREPPTLVAGVAVATSLMPPLCSTGYGLAKGDSIFAAFSLYKLGINIVFIAFAASIVFMLLRVPLVHNLDSDNTATPEKDGKNGGKSGHLRRNLVIGTILFAIPCIIASGYVLHITNGLEDFSEVEKMADAYDTKLTSQELDIICPDLKSYTVGERVSYSQGDERPIYRLVATVTTAGQLDDQRRQEIEKIIHLHADAIDEVEFHTAEPDA